MKKNPIIQEKEKWNNYYKDLPLLIEDEGVKKFNLELSRIILDLVPPGSKVLEAGCGGGWQSFYLLRSGKVQVALMDFSKEALKYAQRLFKKENLKADFLLEDVFEKGQPIYDLVFNAGSIEHYNFDDQVRFLQGMASRSRKFVLILVPNRLCYWYWLWRVQKSAQGLWSFGKEVPLQDLSKIFKAAGIKFLGQAFVGETWTEVFIENMSGIQESIKKQILLIHRSPLIPKACKSYLLAGLGIVTEKEVKISEIWRNSSSSTCDWSYASENELFAALSDSLALQIKREEEIAKLKTKISDKLQKFQNQRYYNISLLLYVLYHDCRATLTQLLNWLLRRSSLYMYLRNKDPLQEIIDLLS